MLQHMLVGPKADALCAAASIIKPIHNVKDGDRNRLLASNREIRSRFIQSDQSVPGGAYRDRTDDPLLAKQVLSQLS